MVGNSTGDDVDRTSKEEEEEGEEEEEEEWVIKWCRRPPSRSVN